MASPPMLATTEEWPTEGAEEPNAAGAASTPCDEVLAERPGAALPGAWGAAPGFELFGAALPEDSPACCMSPEIGDADDPRGLTRLKEYFNSLVAGGPERTLTADAFLRHVRECVEERSGKPLPEDLSELLDETARRRRAEIDLGLAKILRISRARAAAADTCDVDDLRGIVANRSGDGITAEEWAHHMALRSSAPSFSAAQRLDQRLRATLSTDPGLLARLQAAFETADLQGDGLLPRHRFQDALRQFRGRPAASRAAYDEAVRHIPRSSSARSPATPAVEPVDAIAGGRLNYFEFVSRALGAKASPVELARYDLSNGYANRVPAALVGGHKFEGIWHTGVRVFDKEWWFGGAIFMSEPDETPFGIATRTESLGMTLRSRDELREFCQDEMCTAFTSRNYDVLNHNCNHFSNEIVQFLLRGKQIPDEIRLQPEWAQSTSLVQYLRPVLNKWLGGFGPDCGGCHLNALDDMTEEWRSRVQAGDIVLYRRRYIDRPEVVRVLQVDNTSVEPTLQVVYFAPSGTRWREGLAALLSFGEPWDWYIKYENGIGLRHIWPCLDDASVGATVLRAGLLFTGNRRVSETIHRVPPRPVEPICPKGHRLEVAVRSWFSKVPTCHICGKELPKNGSDGLRCIGCMFYVCSACVSIGSELGAGTGVFVDVMTPDLAQDLLRERGWLTYKAHAYFFRTIVDRNGCVETLELRRLADRLCIAFGISRLNNTDLKQVLGNCELLDKPAFVSCFNRLLEHVAKRRRASLLVASVSSEPSRATPFGPMKDLGRLQRLAPVHAQPPLLSAASPVHVAWPSIQLDDMRMSAPVGPPAAPVSPPPMPPSVKGGSPTVQESNPFAIPTELTPAAPSVLRVTVPPKHSPKLPFSTVSASPALVQEECAPAGSPPLRVGMSRSQSQGPPMSSMSPTPLVVRQSPPPAASIGTSVHQSQLSPSARPASMFLLPPLQRSARRTTTGVLTVSPVTGHRSPVSPQLLSPQSGNRQIPASPVSVTVSSPSVSIGITRTL